ncbi:zf-TFIIB domain-containing protein [Cognatishimia sp. MH4019]|uniref:TFIIB-type zinc ribbon-containing protein n=1 Tax=Cognatishimia sp. MH4019 TaxID=2854030 RepID=UPI001CD1BE43|nr:zf-TFIIB domain-containing protein [Cognatishimia sp. MH4019]
MQCPIDGTQLVMTDRSGVEIDYCPQCRGVWLDRGELDKIIERSAAPTPPPPPAGRQSYDDDYRGGDRDYRRDDRGYRKKKKGPGSLLGEIFDF